jgi:hypothetical protein
LIELLMIVETTIKCDRVLDECWNNDENVNVLKWSIWSGYIIMLWWILNQIWDVDWVTMNLGCWWMVVWVLRRIYQCIILKVIVTNGFTSITKDLLFYYIDCNYDECITKDLPLYYIKWNCHKLLYEYYERSTVVLNVNYHEWLLINT